MMVFAGFKDVKRKSYLLNLFELAKSEDTLKNVLAYQPYISILKTNSPRLKDVANQYEERKLR